MNAFYQFLADHNIAYERHDHPPVYTVEDVKRLVPRLPAAETKNLFFRDKKGERHFLIVVPAAKRVDIKKLPAALGAGRLSFGSPDRLKKYLGVDPGAVTLFGIFNDAEHAVEVIIDQDLWQSEAFQFHPLVNTSTLVISRDNLQRFLNSTGHAVKTLAVPFSD
ncbi:MAG: prolyl-tRNA synthetase associated domain-containing protein [Desulfobacterales bacterium]|nr:MAG: prolyl-tRNA synthetase associated domain-containing protein [Desulfobacterales bacterium]